MKGVSPGCSKTESPKTPGGISKSLLTPCRRLGLSRKWKKGGCSPFISPLSTQNSTLENRENTETKKRKKCEDVESLQESEQHSFSSPILSTPDSCDNSNKNNDITTTPCRNTQIPRKKSKTLSLSLKHELASNNESDSQESIKGMTEGKSSETVDKDDVAKEYNLPNTNCLETKSQKLREDNNKSIEDNKIKEGKVTKPTKQASVENVSKVARTESKSKIKLSLKRSKSKNVIDQEQENIKKPPESKEKSPNNLTKECIVVIQKKIFKTASEKTSTKTKESQESDSEPDIPLSMLKKDSENVTLNTLNDDDFICKPTKEVSQKKKIRNLSMIKHNQIESNNASQSSQESIDKRTILIKKSYDKVTKPAKAKSTGSITQKDIDELKARIEKKKKLLMAKAMSIDTEELRELIKKWQKGCQNALMELLELMKKKLPDRQNMDYAEILQSLNIPAELVGYDSENDCFLTPDDTNILLSAFKL